MWAGAFWNDSLEPTELTPHLPGAPTSTQIRMMGDQGAVSGPAELVNTLQLLCLKMWKLESGTTPDANDSKLEQAQKRRPAASVSLPPSETRTISESHIRHYSGVWEM